MRDCLDWVDLCVSIGTVIITLIGVERGSQKVVVLLPEFGSCTV